MFNFDPGNLKGLFLMLLVSGVTNIGNVVSISKYDIKSETDYWSCFCVVYAILRYYEIQSNCRNVQSLDRITGPFIH